MSSKKAYEYEDELFIDSELLCTICLNPFIEPQRTSCNHVFCHRCIQAWFEISVDCPLCRTLFSEKRLESVNNERMLRRLDQLYVKCLLCHKTKIKRKNFDHHIDHQCPEVTVPCSITPSRCSWEGRRGDLQSHQFNCDFRFDRNRSDHHVKENKFKSRFHNFKIQLIINRSPVNSTICLRDQKLTDHDIPTIVQSAMIDKQCRILDLGQNGLRFDGISQLAASLENNVTLEVLSFHQNSLSDSSILCLAEQLSWSNSVLKWLDLESTNLTDRSAGYLATMLINNKSLTGLWLSKNRIGNHGVRMLTSALIDQNTTLENLDLENNWLIDDSALDCLMKMIERNQSLKVVDVNECRLSMRSRTKLRVIADRKSNFQLIL